MTPTTCACGHRPTTVEYVYLRTTPVYFVHCNQCFACGPSAATEERAVKLAIVLAALTLAALLLLAGPARSDGPPPDLTPVLPPPIACGIPGWPACYHHYAYLPAVEARR